MNSTRRILSTIPILRMCGNQAIAIDPDTGRSLRLSPREASTLRAITRSETPLEHAQAISETPLVYTSPLQPLARPVIDRQSRLGRLFRTAALTHSNDVGIREILEDLSRLQELGLLREEQALLDTFPQTGAAEVLTRPLILSVLTCDRPTLLSRGLSSLVSVKGISTHVCLVLDDSTLPSTIASNKNIVDRLCKSGQRSVKYVGLHVRQNIIRTLAARCAVPIRLIELAILPRSPLTTEGGVRNTLSLLSAGSRVVEFDDDAFFTSTDAAMNTTDIGISMKAMPYELWFDKNLRDFSPPEGNPTSVNDVVKGHDAVLGYPISTLLRKASTIRSWPSVSSPLVDRLKVMNGIVRISTTGLIGDPATRSMGGFLLCGSRATMERLCAGGHYHHNMSTRHICRAVNALTLSRQPYLQTVCVGIDNTHLTPPFFPFGRNLDGLFAHLLLKLQGNCWIGHLPSVLSHLPPEVRVDPEPYQEAYSRVRLVDMLIMCVIDAPTLTNTDLSRGLSILGEHLVAVASLPRPSFRCYITDLMMQRRYEILTELDRRLDVYGNISPCLSEDLSQMRGNITKSLTLKEAIIPMELDESVTSETADLEIAKAIYLYGELLQAWPQLWEEARQSTFDHQLEDL